MQTERPSPVRGAVSGQVLEAGDVDRYRPLSGERYEQPFPRGDQADPIYPPALLAKRLPPVVVTVKLTVTPAGDVVTVESVDAPADAAFLASVRDAVLHWQFFPLVRIVPGPGKTALQTGDVFTTYDGAATALSFSRVYQFTFSQSGGVAKVDAAPH